MRINGKLIYLVTVFLLLQVGWFFSCGDDHDSAVKLQGKNIALHFDENMHSRVAANFSNHLTQLGEYTPSEYLTVSGDDITDFKFHNQSETSVQDEIGSGKQYTLTGTAGDLQKEV
ncbi:MAG: hypothetical protein WAN36_08425, partial [Calditrichia bacterium]